MSGELESLLVSGKEMNAKLVGEILKPYLQIEKETGDIRPLSSWADLKSNVRILLFLIARKATVALGLPLSEEAASPTEIMQKTGMKKGTVNPGLRVLFGEGLIKQTEDKKYYVPNVAIEEVKAKISEK